MTGGTRQYDFGRELVKGGYRVTIFAASFSYTKHKETKFFGKEKWKIETINGVKFVWLKSFPYKKNNWRRVVNILGFALSSYRIGRKIHKLCEDVSRPDLIIAFSVPLLAPLSAYYLAKTYNAEYIIEVGDLWPQTLIDMDFLGEKNPITFILRYLEKFLYKRSAKIITNLPFAGKYITSLGIEQEKIVWIPNGVVISRYETTEEKKKINEDFKVMYLGAHGPANALDVILDAAHLIQKEGYKKIKFVFIGDGAEKERLIQNTKNFHINNVEFHDPVPRTKVPAALSKGDVFVLSLKKINLYKYGINLNKIFDYMMIGKPIILSGDPANNLVEEANCGLSVPPENPEKLKEAVIRLYKSSSVDRKNMGDRGKQYSST